MPRLMRTLVWQRLDVPGMEIVQCQGAGLQLAYGVVLGRTPRAVQRPAGSFGNRVRACERIGGEAEEGTGEVTEVGERAADDEGEEREGEHQRACVYQAPAFGQPVGKHACDTEGAVADSDVDRPRETVHARRGEEAVADRNRRQQRCPDVTEREDED